MTIQNDSPSLFGIALKNLLEAACLSTQPADWEMMIGIWFSKTTTPEHVRSWLEETSFPNGADFKDCIILARVFLKNKATQHYKIAQEFFSVLDLPLTTVVGATLPLVTKCDLSIGDERCRSITEYYFRSDEKIDLMLSVHNMQLPFTAKEYLVSKYFGIHLCIQSLMEEIVFPSNEAQESEDARALSERRIKFAEWAFSHGSELFELGVKLNDFLRKEDAAFYERLKTFMETMGAQILLPKTT